MMDPRKFVDAFQYGVNLPPSTTALMIAAKMEDIIAAQTKAEEALGGRAEIAMLVALDGKITVSWRRVGQREEDERKLKAWKLKAWMEAWIAERA